MFICSQLLVANQTNIKGVLHQTKDELETDDGHFCTMLEYQPAAIGLGCTGDLLTPQRPSSSDGG